MTEPDPQDAPALRPHPPSRTDGNHWAPLIDNEVAFDAIGDAIHGARHSILLSQLLFEPTLHAPAGPQRTGAAATRPDNLAHVLRDAAQRGVTVRVLLNENLLVPDHVDELQDLFQGAKDTQVRAARRNPGVMHAKLIVIDGKEAFVVGSPFQQQYWDTRRHTIPDPRRGEGNRAHHDVSVHLRGPIVHDVAATFERLWAGSSTARLVPAPSEDAAPLPPLPPADKLAGAGPHTLVFATTAPDMSASSVLGRPAQTGCTDILDAYKAALARAERFVYLENQYLTSAAFVEALRGALDRKPDLQAVLLLNEHMDLPGYDGIQLDIIKRLIGDYGDRVGVFGLWTDLDGIRTGEDHGDEPRSASGARAPGRPAPQKARLHSVYIHTKVAIIDDEWATIGTANLDGASLEGAAELGADDTRNEEANVFLLDGIDGAPATGAAARLRADLWAEHFDEPPDTFLGDMPAEGWLPLWQARATENVRRVHAAAAAAQGKPARPGEPMAVAEGGAQREAWLKGSILPFAPDLPRKGLELV